ncbi:hypothetical protein ACVWYG_003846 [Pedobacter sp. UYEF25]
MLILLKHQYTFMLNIVIKVSQLTLLSAVFFLTAFAQNSTKYNLLGKIQDEKNEVIGGATLILKDVGTGQIVSRKVSEVDGRFSFSVSEGSYVLSISYLGTPAYQGKTIKVTGDADLGILKIMTETRTLKEVVVQDFANKPIVKIEGRKLIYHVENSTTGKGLNALEAL